MTILVIAAHPDDEVLGCGGTIARLAQEGHDLYIAILGEGITSRYRRQEDADQSSVKLLHTCSRKVAELLGAKDVFMYSLPDNRFDTLALLDVVNIIEELITRLRPRVIYTHHRGDLNIDHAVVHRAVLTATRPVADSTVKEIYAFEVPSSTEWAFGQFPLAFCPNVFVDIGPMLKVKIQAMKIYKSEVRPYPHPRSSKALQAIAMRWGSVVGNQYTEVFELIRSLR